MNQVVDVIARVACEYASPMVYFDAPDFITTKLLHDCTGFSLSNIFLFII